MVFHNPGKPENQTQTRTTEARGCIPAADTGAPVFWAQELTTSLTWISDIAADGSIVSVRVWQQNTTTRPNMHFLQQQQLSHTQWIIRYCIVQPLWMIKKKFSNKHSSNSNS